ncbi:hypothetical protein VCHA57P526_10016 [Vibrio chagasii]|nr:hypothetical protein VCHA57P526_10016 [Vibrio chagasii]
MLNDDFHLPLSVAIKAKTEHYAILFIFLISLFFLCSFFCIFRSLILFKISAKLPLFS